jgi:hypothetical protein
METEAVSITAQVPSLPDLGKRQLAALRSILPPTSLIAMFGLAWWVRQSAPYTAQAGFGYAIGLIGGSLMLALLLYPLRKRMRALQVLGPLRHWFRFHQIAGILGPVLVVYHSAFHVRSFNAAIALASMLLVVASGLVGRFLYRKIHKGLYGSRSTQQELEKAMNEQLAMLQPVLERMPEVQRQVARFMTLVNWQPAGRWQRIRRFVSLSFFAGQRIRSAIVSDRRRSAAHSESRSRLASDRAEVDSLLATLKAALAAIRRTAQFATYERLFALWHVIHIPFLVMLVITAIVHVVAVHAY